jgi:hypothetical protein
LPAVWTFETVTPGKFSGFFAIRAKAARTVFAVAGAEGKDADGRLLSLKPVYTPERCSIRQSPLQRANLSVVLCDEKKVIQTGEAQ